METVQSNYEFQVPEHIAICPDCGGKLLAHAEQWEQQEDGTWTGDLIKTECSTFPGFYSEEGDKWMSCHYRMPYVDWLPIDIRVEKWVNESYRFAID